MRWMALALLGLFGCGLTLDLTPPVDGARPPAPDGGTPDAQTDAPPDAPGCSTDADCASLTVGSCVSRCLPSGVCLLPDQDGDGVGPGCPDERDCDDSDPDVGIDGIRACDPGAGMCAAGAVQRCSGGVFGACQPARDPAADDSTCDGFDDDCDGSIDEDAGRISTGTDLCATTYTCMDGSWSPSTPPPGISVDGCTPPGETPTDDDCDGRIDEDCAPAMGDCIFVSAWPPLPPGPVNLASAIDPSVGVPSVDVALGLMSNPAAPKRICLLAARSSGACSRTIHNVTTDIPGGVTIVGNLTYSGGTVTSCPGGDRTVLLPPGGGLVVRGSAAAPVALLDLSVAFPASGTQRAIDVRAGATLILGQVQVKSDATSDTGGISQGVRVPNRATLFATASRIEGGAGDEAYGIDATNADVLLLNSCGSSTCRPGCGGDSPAVRGGTYSTDGAAIRSDGGSLTVARYAVCQGTGPKGIESSGAALTVLDSVVEVSSGSESLLGLRLDGCRSDTPDALIVRSSIELNSTSPADERSDGFAVRVEQDCNVGLFNNSAIVGAASGFFDQAIGVTCDGTCALAGNTAVGAESRASAFDAVAVHGDNQSTLVLHGNELRGSASVSTTNATGVAMEGVLGAFARNRIVGGCASDATTGALFDGDAGRIENNVLIGYECTDEASNGSVGMAIIAGEVDVNGNTATSGKLAAADRVCVAIGLANDTDRSVFRNNVFADDPLCGDHASVVADTLPAVFDHNGLAFGVFVDDENNALASNIEVLRLNPAYRGNVFTDDPQFVRYPSDLHIGASSPFARAGTPVGAPAEDFDGAPRPRPPSMGAFEPPR